MILAPDASAQSAATTQSVLDTLDLGEIEKWASGSELVSGDLKSLLGQMAGGRAILDGGALLRLICSKVLGTLSASLKTIAFILVPSLLTGIVRAMRTSFSKPFLATLAEYAGFLVVGGFLFADLARHVELANTAVGNMAGAMQAIFPVLVTLLVAVGGTASQAVFQPAVAWAGGTMTALIQSVTMPYSLAMAVASMVDSLSDRLMLGRLSRLFQRVAHWTLGIGFTVFLGVTMAQGLGAAAVDGVSIRTAKYALDNFIPIVGGMFADTVDTLVGCSLLIKNAVGLLGLILIAGTMLTPLVQTLITSLTYRAAAALLEPLAAPRLVKTIDDFAQVMTLLFIVQASVGAMLILLLAQVLVVGNWTVMMR